MHESPVAVQAAPAPSPPSVTPAGRSASVLGRVRSVLPTAVVLAGLAGLAWWGHRNDWTVPKFSALVGAARDAEPAWCDEHSVPESVCVECDPERFPRRPELAWCKTHGVPECPFEHPEIAQVQGTPQRPRYDVLAALRLLDRPEVNRRCKLHQRRLQFASAAAAEKAGVDVDVVNEAPMEEFVAAPGELGYDQTRLAHLASRVPGAVWRVEKQVGEAVRAGDVLALVDAAEVGKAKAEFLQAYVQLELRHRTLEGLRRVSAAGAVSERQLREAESALSEGRIRLVAARQALVNLGLPVETDELKGKSEEQVAEALQFLGLPDAAVAGLDPKRTTANLLAVKAPLDGLVVEREVVAGEVVDAAKTLFVVADPRRLWLTLNIRQEDARHVALGQPVRFRPDGDTQEAPGRVDWVSTAADHQTRTVKLRAFVDNAAGGLRANTFGAGRVVLRSEPNAVVVPKEAVHWEGDCYVVFVRDRDYLEEQAPKVFHVRKVRLGARDEQSVEVLAGVLPGEVVATKGSGVLQAELLKARLGEG